MAVSPHGSSSSSGIVYMDVAIDLDDVEGGCAKEELELPKPGLGSKLLSSCSMATGERAGMKFSGLNARACRPCLMAVTRSTGDKVHEAPLTK